MSEAKKNKVQHSAALPRFDIEREDFYEHGQPKERTRKRLAEIAECGMEEIGSAQFGYKGVMSGLYIEKVWSYSDEAFKDYMDWARGLISKSMLDKHNYGEIIPDTTVDSFYMQIKRCLDENLSYEHYVANLIKLNGKIPDKIQ
jgi:hypothetical protein